MREGRYSLVPSLGAGYHSDPPTPGSKCWKGVGVVPHRVRLQHGCAVPAMHGQHIGLLDSQKSHLAVPVWCSQAPAACGQCRQSRLGAFPGTGNSLFKRLHRVGAAQSQDNAPRLLSTKLQSSSQLHLAGLFPPPPPHLVARHQSQPQLCSRGDSSSTSVTSETQTGAVA